MNYLINEDNLSITDRILKINDISKDKLDVSSFFIDEDIEIVNRFKEGLLENKDKKFLIVGDYDCDGICATTIIKRLLDKLEIKANFYIPSRTLEGYGLNNKIVETAIQNNFDCLFMVDNGVACIEQLNLCKQSGIKTFIIDHHEYEGDIPCDYFLHPNLFNDKYSDMCAGGLCGLFSSYFFDDEYSLVLGGLATLADMVSVLNYNRYLLKKMLEILRKGEIYQINYLMGKNNYSYDNLSYNVIPKINAVSRLDEYLNVNHVVEYLLADKNTCANYYSKIDNINSMRKDYSSKMVQEAMSNINLSENIIITSSKDYKEGLCGLVANKLLGSFNKSVIVLALVNGEYRGSGRSIAGVDLYSYLKDLDIFSTFGGHAQAVGMSFAEDKLSILKEYINNHPLKVVEESRDILKVNIEDLTFDTLNELEELKPFGTKFDEPMFILEDVKYIKKYVIAYKYPKFVLNDLVEAISFNSNFLNVPFKDMIGKLQIDGYHPNKLSFKIEDLI